MRMNRIAMRVSVAVAAVVVLAGIAGCPARNGPPDGQEPPEIPPLSTFEMDFDEFNNTDSSKVMNGAQGVTSLVRARAAFQVGFWQTILTVHLFVPVAAFAESFNHSAAWNPDGYWAWNYQFRAAGELYSAELQARIVENQVQWDMYISKEGVFENVHWFSGLTGILTRTGTWTVNRDPNEVIPYIQIDYEYETDNPDIGEIKYASIEEGVELYDSYIIHAAFEGDDYDRSYTIYIDVDDNLVEIEWDRLMQDGRTREPAFYGDDEWRCWDETLIDVECPAGG